jgi:hypothetical protein
MEDVLSGTVELVVLHHPRDHVEGLTGFVGGGFLGRSAGQHCVFALGG